MLKAEAPRSVYRRETRAHLMTLSPRSLLDVGCGSGDVLRAGELSACSRRAGLEPDDRLVSQLRSEGLEVYPGCAEAMPFPEGSFDVVLFEYVTHHLEDLARGLAEAARVARRAVVVVDRWYDAALPSQRTALAFDLWCMEIDRLAGETHNPCPSAVQIAAPFQAHGGFTIDYVYRLIVQDASIAEFEQIARTQLERIVDSEQAGKRLARVREQLQTEGMTEHGLLRFTAVKD